MKPRSLELRATAVALFTAANDACLAYRAIFGNSAWNGRALCCRQESPAASR